VDPESYDGETYRTPTGVHFRKEPDGIIREMVDALLTEREEKKELRNEYDPDTEPYERYDRQQGAVKVIMNCFTPDTEVLTPAGVRNIRDLGVGDEVYSLDPDSMEMEVKPVTDTHEYPDYRGELVDVETSKVDFRVTPNHRMLVRKNDTNGISWDVDDYRFVEAGDLDDATNYELPHDWTASHGEELEAVDLTELLDDGYEVWVRPEVHGHTFAAEIGYYPDKVLKNDVGEEGYVFSAEEFEEHREYIEEVAERTYVHAESGRKWIPRTYDGDDFLELLAWYVTEGNVYTSEEKEFGDKLRGSATTVKIAQERAVADGGYHGSIGDLLDRMGFDYYVDDRSYQFTSKLFGDLLERIAGDDSYDKRIPDLVFECSERQKRRFLDALIDGDGDRQPNSWRYTTSSEGLRDDVLRLCTHLGLTASYNRDSGSWRVYCSEDGKNTLRMHRSGGRSTADDGVYCVTVEDNHTLLAGRNGKFQFVGNSLYGVFGWDRFRLYDREMSAGVTSTNREVINFTEQTVDDLGYSVTYGDSVTGDRPVVVRDPSGIVRIRPIAELFDEAATPADGVPVPSTDGGVDSRSSTKQYRRIDGWEALSLSEDGTAEWKPITRVIRHETDKQVVTLQHKFGESTTTEDHSYVVDRDGEYVESPPEDVEEPLRIPDIPSVDTLESIDVYEVLDGYTREYEDGRSVGTENATTKTKGIHADEDRVWFGHEHHADLDGTVTVQRHVDLTSEDGEALVRLLAAYVSEGSASTVETTDSRFGASISQDRTDWLDGLQSDYHRLFENTAGSVVASDTGDDRTVSYDTADGEREVTYSDGTSKLQMMNELAAVFFREFAGQTSRGKRVPSFVFHLPENLQDLFLDVLIEGDGSRKFPRYSDEYAERNFDFETTSRKLAAGLSTLLTQRGRKHSLKYRDSKDSYTIRTCDFYRSGRDPVVEERDHDGYVYDLSVADNENFVDGVGGIVLHNTDSVMIELGESVSKGEAIDTSFDIEEAINASYDEFTREQLNAEDHRFQIEFEKLYRRFFQAGKKKRYAGHIVWKEGKDVDDIDITGFEYQRSDIAPITKRVQREVIDMIVTGEAIEDVEAYVAEVIEDFQDGNVDLDDVGIPGGIGKRLDAYDTDTAQVRGAKYANLLFGTNFGRGSKPKRLYLEKNGIHPDYLERIDDDLREDPQFKAFKREVSAGDGVICFEYADQVPEEFRVDWDKMLDKTLKGPIARILEALDVSWEEVKTGQQQTGLGSFM
jgi:DNA polymerase elongation subunit (family B)